MLSLISLGRGLWQRFQTAHPVIRWTGAILIGLIVLEFIGDEAINLYIKMQTARPTIEKANADAARAEAESRAATDRVLPLTCIKDNPPAWCNGVPAAAKPDSDPADMRADCLELQQKHVANPADIIEACRSVGVALSQGNAATESDADFLKRFRKDPVSVGGGCAWPDNLTPQQQRLKDMGIENHAC